MNDYVTNTTFEDLAERVRKSKRVAFLTHSRPDGDAVGSTVALARAFEGLGIDSEIWYSGPIDDAFKSIIHPTEVNISAPGNQPDSSFDLVIITDTGARSQMVDFHDWLEENRDLLCILDHHLQGDADLADCRIVNAQACAASEVAAGLIDALGIHMDVSIAEPLYVGVATDTGWFRFSNTSAGAFRLAARLLETGVDHSSLYRLIEQTDEPSRLRLLARALDSMELLNGGRIALLTLRSEDYKECGATTEQSHGFSDIPHCVGSIEVVCLVAEPRAGLTKVSLRSKDGPNAVDVNDFARQFGGGGHARASGAKIYGPLDEVRPMIAQALGSL